MTHQHGHRSQTKWARRAKDVATPRSCHRLYSAPPPPPPSPHRQLASTARRARRGGRHDGECHFTPRPYTSTIKERTSKKKQSQSQYAPLIHPALTESPRYTRARRLFLLLMWKRTLWLLGWLIGRQRDGPPAAAGARVRRRSARPPSQLTPTPRPRTVVSTTRGRG